MSLAWAAHENLSINSITQLKNSDVFSNHKPNVTVSNRFALGVTKHATDHLLIP